MPPLRLTREFLLSEHREEDLLWSNHVAPVLSQLAPKNVISICHYGFTEMFNNVVDHSGATVARVHLLEFEEEEELVLCLEDDGVGIFEKIRVSLGLESDHQAILELSKGKLTTDPTRHSGEGIFFTSRAFDRIFIASGGLEFSHQPGRKDQLDPSQESVRGTEVYMAIDKRTDRTMKGVFDAFSDVDKGFYRTEVRIELAREGQSELMSRSQAKRVLARCDQFQEVILDFTGIDFIGQGFADEIFRVFRNQHRAIQIRVIQAGEQVDAMIRRVQADADP